MAIGNGGRAVSPSLDDNREMQLQIEIEDVRRQRLALENRRKIKAEHANDTAEDDDQWLLALNAQPNTDPFACFCRCKFKKLGQSYILHERRRVHRNRVSRELILVGPHWIGVVVTLSILVGCTGLFLHQQCTLLPWYYTLYTLLFCGATLYYLYGVACKDPGIVMPVQARREIDDKKPTKDLSTTVLEDDDDADHVEEDQASDALESGGRPRVRTSQTIRSMVSPGRRRPETRMCDVCDVPQDAYTEHCEDCGVCIEDYDHHCPWMGKCIGKNNMHAFKMFNLCWVLYVIFVLAVSIQNVDWGTVAVQRLHRLSTGEWVPVGTTEAPRPGTV